MPSSFFTFFSKHSGSTTGIHWLESIFVFKSSHGIYNSKSFIIFCCWNLSQLKIRWTRWTLSGFETKFPFIPSDWGVSLVPAQRVSLPWSSCRWPNLWWIDVPGFKNESLTYIEVLDDSNESKWNSNLIHLGVTQLVIFDGSMVKTRVILELYLYLWWCCM